MEKMQPGKQRYMNPIALQAEMFVYNLEALMEKNKTVDEILLSSLQKLLSATEEFLDSNAGEIFETKKIQLVKSINARHILRTFGCKNCSKVLGISAEKVTLHMIDCIQSYSDEESSVEAELQCLRRRLEFQTYSDEGYDPPCLPSTDFEGIKGLINHNLDSFIKCNLEAVFQTKYWEDYELLVKELLSILLPLFPGENVRIYKYGSRIFGIRNKISELDLFIDIGNTFHQYQNPVSDELCLKYHKFALDLRSHANWDNIEICDYDRVPFITACHRRIEISCCFRFHNGLGVMNTKFLQYIFDIQPIAQVLCIFVATWMKRTRLEAFLNTYSMVLMVLFYLQTVGAIPTMEQLQDYLNPKDSVYIGPWLCTFSSFTNTDLDIKADTLVGDNLLLYIKGFFNFYKNFDFKHEIICPYLGRAVKKLVVRNHMPKRYTEFVEKFPESKLKVNTPIVVQDPIELNHNTTKNLGMSFLLTFQYFITGTLEILDNRVVEEFVWEPAGIPRRMQKFKVPKKKY